MQKTRVACPLRCGHCSSNFGRLSHHCHFNCPFLPVLANAIEILPQLFIFHGIDIKPWLHKKRGKNIQETYHVMCKVSTVPEMMEMIKTSRQFEASQRVMRTADDLLSTAIHQLGEGNV